MIMMGRMYWGDCSHWMGASMAPIVRRKLLRYPNSSPANSTFQTTDRVTPAVMEGE